MSPQLSKLLIIILPILLVLTLIFYIILIKKFSDFLKDKKEYNENYIKSVEQNKYVLDLTNNRVSIQEAIQELELKKEALIKEIELMEDFKKYQELKTLDEKINTAKLDFETLSKINNKLEDKIKEKLKNEKNKKK